MKLHIANGRLIDPAGGIDAHQDLFIADGRVAGVGFAPDGFTPERVIDARGLAILPGLVDLCARLGDPAGDQHQCGFESEMTAALAGGVTSLVAPPDTMPVLDEPGAVASFMRRSRLPDQARLHPLGAMTAGLRGETLAEMAALGEAGCVAFSNADRPLRDSRVLMHAMQYARTFDYALWLRPEDHALAQGGVAASGAYATRLGLAGVPAEAETVGLHILFELQRSTGVRLHLCRLSSARGIELVRTAKREGLPVTSDVSINHVHLTDIDIGFYDSSFRLQPPLRGQRDREAILRGLADGTIDAICSDHVAIGDAEKSGSFAQSRPGAGALELLLPLTLAWARQARLPEAQALARVTSGPGSVLASVAPDAPARGCLALNAAADFCLVDLEESWRVPSNPCRHTPFTGMEMVGRVHATYVGGHAAWAAS